MDKPYNLNRPPHLIAAEVLRRIGALNKVQFGKKSHAIVEQLVAQYQDKLVEESLKTSVPQMADRDALHIRFFQEIDGLWYAYLKTDEYTTHHVYSATGITRHQALQNLVSKMDDI